MIEDFKTVIVKNLNDNTCKCQVRKHFENVGEVDTIEIIHDCRGRSKGVAFVTFECENDAGKAVKTLRNSVLDGNAISVDYIFIKRIPTRENHERNEENHFIRERKEGNTNLPASNFIICVKTLTGKRFELNVNPYYRIEEVKEMIQEKEDIPPNQQYLIYAGRPLQDGNDLMDYAIGNKSTINLVLRLKGSKPVIYLYPEKDDFDVSVNVSVKKEDGEITSIYPRIKDDESNTWIVKANRNGEIDYNNRKHYYLFWECLFNESFNIDEGFVIKGDQCYQFFEEKLQFLGFKDNEANDFITYWCPRMEHSKYVLINFQGEDYDRRAPLKIEPNTDRIIHIFMTFKLLDEFISIPIQDIEKFKIEDRKGFFVLEWGGSQIKE